MKAPILVAGGNSGIARHLVEQLAASGQPVICAARRPDEITTSERVRAEPFDASDESILPQLPEALDGLVYCPGTITLKPFHQLKTSDFLKDLEVNLLGAVRLLQHALPALKNSTIDSPGVVLFSTVAVKTGMPFHASIAAAKGAVEGLAVSLAAELAPKIRFNVIAPSLTDTPLASRFLGSEERIEAARKRHPLHQVGSPGDIATLTSFLLGEHSRFMTGQVLGIDGGLSSVSGL